MASTGVRDFVDRVRAAVDLVALVSEFVPLKRVGRRHRGLCPFHSEKTPSFYVDDSKGLFFCFGCQTGGDAFKFVMLRENVEFLEAAKMLAARSGIPVPDPRGGRPSERQSILAAHAAAADFFHQLLKERPEGKAAREYLKSRGIASHTVDQLRMGFAPDQWDGLKGYLTSKGFSTGTLVTAGLLVKHESKGTTYDRFRNRIMFPIKNLSGAVVAFGGRLLGPGDPKYLNSAETPIYNKRENLYGLDLTRDSIREASEAIVVEGYFDFASLYQAGVGQVVATLGTAFSEGQASLLRRFAERVVINYDPDAAGASATRRSIDLLVGWGFKIRILQLEGGKDPDEFVRQEGSDAYRRFLGQAPRYFDYLLDEATAGKDLTNYEHKSAALQEILPAIGQVPDRIERSGYINVLADRLGIEDDVMLAEIRESLLKSPSSPKRPRIAATTGTPTTHITEAEAGLVRALLESADIRQEVFALLSSEDVAGSPIEAMVRAVEGLLRAGEEISYARLSEILEEPASSSLARLAVRPDPIVSREEALRCLESLRLRRLRRERENLQREMDGEADATRLDEMMRRKLEVSRQIDALS